MRTPRLSHPRRVAFWLAIIAMWLGSLAPMVSHAFSHALARGGDIGLQAICTSSLPDAPKPDAGHLFDHCPCCGAHAGAIALPPAALAVSAPQAVLQRVLPQRFLSAARTPHAWSSAQPRAPPLPV